MTSVVMMGFGSPLAVVTKGGDSNPVWNFLVVAFMVLVVVLIIARRFRK